MIWLRLRAKARWGFFAVLILGTMSSILGPRRVNVSETLLYAGSMAAGLVSRRHSPFFVIVAIPLIAQAFWGSLPPTQVSFQ